MKSFEIPTWEKDVVGDNTYELVAKANLSKSLKKKSKKKIKGLNEIAKTNSTLLQINETKTKNGNAISVKKDKRVSNDTSLHLNNKDKQRKTLKNKTKIKNSKLDNVKTQLRSNNLEHVNTKNVTPKLSKKTKKSIIHDKPIIGRTKNKLELPATKSCSSSNIESKSKVISQPENSKALNNKVDTQKSLKNNLKIQKLKKVLQSDPGNVNELKKVSKRRNELSLRERMLNKLKSAQFRYINEQIYTTESKDAVKLFKEDKEAFNVYHEGYRQQVQKWPLNPLDTIINSIKKMNKNLVVADFGCGEAKLAQSLQHKVHSFDLVAANDSVTVCDMSKVPLPSGSVDIVVCCLSLMGTNLADYIYEANRVLKVGGVLKIAEVESRFDPVEDFIKGVSRFGFKKTWQDLSHNLFYFIDFQKVVNVKNRQKLPTLSLHPCLYKKR